MKADYIISIIFILLLILFLDPFMILMPSSLMYMALVVLLVVFIFFVGLLWRERKGDERTEIHRMFAGRIGYLGGVTVLLLGIIFQAFQGDIDAWVVCALGVMIIGKLGALIWSDYFA